MEQKLETLERKVERLQAEFEQFRTEAKTERAAISNQASVTNEQLAATRAQIASMNASLSGLIQQRDEREKLELKRENELKSGRIQKLEAEIEQRTLTSTLKQADPVLSVLLKTASFVGVIWMIFKYLVRSVN